MKDNSRKHIWYRKIKFRIVAVSLLSGIIPLILIGLFIILKMKTTLIEQDVRNQQSKTGSIRQGINIIQKMYEKQLLLLAQDPRVQSSEPKKLLEALYVFLDMNPRYSSSFVYDSKGNIIQLAFRNRYHGLDSKYIGRNILNSKVKKYANLRDSFRNILKTKKPAVCMQYSLALKERLLLVMVPFFNFGDNETIAGIISCAVNIDGPAMDELIRGYPLDKEDILILVDRNGDVLASRGDALPSGLKKLKFPEEVIKKSGLKPARFILNKLRYLGVIDHIGSLNSFILIGRPRSIVMSSLSQVLFNLLLVFIIGVVIALGLSLILTRSLALRLEALIEAIRFVCTGVVSHRIEDEGADELADACVAFNEMTATLEKHRIMNEIWTREWNQDDQN